MKLRFKIKPKLEHIYKCYRCGNTSIKKVEFCPTCIEEGFNIQMITMMEDK